MDYIKNAPYRNDTRAFFLDLILWTVVRVAIRIDPDVDALARIDITSKIVHLSDFINPDANIAMVANTAIADGPQCVAACDVVRFESAISFEIGTGGQRVSEPSDEHCDHQDEPYDSDESLLSSGETSFVTFSLVL